MLLASTDPRLAVIEATIASEGGWTDNPHDHGGCTNYGITLPTLMRARNDVHLTCEDVRGLTKAEAVHIYTELYAVPFLSIVPPLVFSAAFNGAVQHGTETMIRAIQKALGLVVDGQCGPKTTAAISLTADATLLGIVLRARLEIYANLMRQPSQREFAAGWMHRLARDLTV